MKTVTNNPGMANGHSLPRVNGAAVIHLPSQEENKAVLDEFLGAERKDRSEMRAAVLAAIPALERLCGVMCDRSGQCYKVRHLLYSLYNGQPAKLIEVVCLDWAIRKDLCAVMLAFGYEAGPGSGIPSEAESRETAPDFFYDALKAAVTKAGQWKWFLKAHQAEAE